MTGRGRVRWPVVLSLVLLAGTACGTAGPRPRVSTPTSDERGVSAAPLYGVTIDDISDLPRVVAGLRSLPAHPAVRVVFNADQSPYHYLAAVRLLAGSATVMGDLLDSSDETAVTAPTAASRARQFLSVLGSYVRIWEVGNEVNGNWLGSSADVTAKLEAAYAQIHAGGGRTALTLYADQFGPDHCGDGPGELTPEQFSAEHVPAATRRQLDYVLLSYYPDQCGGVEPGSAAVRSELVALHRLYPAAALGFGEVGLADPVTSSTSRRGAQIMAWAYSLDPGLSYYIGGYFWWYGYEDALGPGQPLESALVAGFRAEAAALARR